MKRFLNMPTLTVGFAVINMGKLSYECMLTNEVGAGTKFAVLVAFFFVSFVLGACVAFDAGKD